jgi:hypothetical protein
VPTRRRSTSAPGCSWPRSSERSCRPARASSPPASSTAAWSSPATATTPSWPRFDEAAVAIDRLRVRALAAPAGLLDAARDLRDPIGATHPLRVAAALARLGANPADPREMDAHEEAILLALAPSASATRPHDDPDPARRVARRILQRLAGMGKWGGYHTEFSHLARGFSGNDKQLAEEVGERLIASGLLQEKPSVGQRHVFLNPRRARDVYALVDEGTVPDGLQLK